MASKAITIMAAALILGGCSSTHELVKDVEGKAYDSLARAFSEYCQRQEGMFAPVVEQEALEARREIRQRGMHGPMSPEVPGLDDQTENGRGPVVRVYCADDLVPGDVWFDFIRVRP